jgi:hypothetical protein
MNKVLMVMAHPDDEVIFGWPILTAEQYIRYVLIVSENKHGIRGVRALQEVCARNRVGHMSAFRIANNYYRLPPRDLAGSATLPDALRTITNMIKEACKVVKPDFIFTHNPWGEYGHGDHRFLFDLVSNIKVPLLVTDICQFTDCHLSFNAIPPVYGRFLETSIAKTEHRLNKKWFNHMKEIYDKYNAWSWSGHEVIDSCKLHQF